MNISFRKIFIICIISIFIGLLYNFFNPRGIELIKIETKLEVVNDSISVFEETLNNYSTSTNHTEPKAIYTNQAFQLFKSKTALFIDSRDQWEFNENHIKGAINIPEYKFDPNDPIVFSLNRSNTYIIYCGGDDCDVSKRLAEQLSELGFSQLLVFQEGFDDWLRNDYPTENSLNK